MIPAAASVAGIAGGGYMIYDGIKGFTDKNATALDKSVNAAEIAGGAAGVAGGAIVGSGVVAGLAGAGAANAWNPVGWGLLIAAGVTALGTAIYKGVKEQEEHNKALQDTVENNRAMAKDIKAQWDAFNGSIQDELDTRKDNLEEIRTELENGKSADAVRTELIQSGALNEEQVNSLRDAEGKALRDLINTYITETGKLSGVADDVSDAFSNYNQDVTGGARNEIARFLNDHKGNEKGNANYDPVYDAVTQAYNTINAKENKNETEQKFLDMYNKKNKNGMSRTDLKDIINKYGDQQIANWLTEDDLKKLAKGRSGKTYGEHMTNYNSKKLDTAAAELITKAAGATSKEQAIAYLKQSGYTPESADPYKTQINYVLENSPYGIQWSKEKGYFRTGTDSIPYDNYPAMLHEGEAVLTASTANELRGLVDEYRATKEDNIKLEKAIQDQTTVLVSRLDAIYNKIGNPDSDTSIMPRKIRQRKSNG